MAARAKHPTRGDGELVRRPTLPRSSLRGFTPGRLLEGHMGFQPVDLGSNPCRETN